MTNILLFIIIVAIAILIPCFVFWTDGNIEYLIHITTGKVVDIPILLSTLISFVFNGATLVFNLIVEVMKVIGV